MSLSNTLKEISNGWIEYRKHCDYSIRNAVAILFELFNSSINDHYASPVRDLFQNK